MDKSKVMSWRVASAGDGGSALRVMLMVGAPRRLIALPLKEMIPFFMSQIKTHVLRFDKFGIVHQSHYSQCLNKHIQAMFHQLFNSVQTLTLGEKEQVQANAGLGSAAAMSAAAAASTASSSQLVRGDDLRWNTLATAAQLSGGKLVVGQLPTQATMLSIPVANEAARLALSAGVCLGQLIYQLDSQVSYVLKTGGDPTLGGDWVAVGGAVTLAGIGGLSVFIGSYLGAANQAAAKTLLEVANLQDVPATTNALVKGKLVINGASANTFTLDASALPGAFTLLAPYQATGGPFYQAITVNASGIISIGDVTSLGATLTAKANLVSGKVPIGELPESVTGERTAASKLVANQAARLALAAIDARGFTVVETDTGKSFLLVAGGVPSSSGDWLQVGDRAVSAADIIDATAAGITLFTAANAAAQRTALALSVGDAVGFHRITSNRNGSVSGAILMQNVSAQTLTLLPDPAMFTARTITFPNNSGIVALCASSSGRIDGSLDVDGWSDKADLIDGVVPLSQLPPVTGQLTTSRLVANQAARLALTEANAENAVVVESDTGKTFMLVSGGMPSVSGDWLQVGDRSVHISELAGAGIYGLSFLALATVLDAKTSLSVSNFADGLLGQGRVSGNLRINADQAETFDIDCSLMSGPVTAYPPRVNGTLATTESTVRASGLNAGRGITSMGVNTILSTDMGTKLEVALGITAVAFPTWGTLGTGAVPGCLDLWVRPTSIALSGAVVYDKFGSVITSLPAGVWHIVVLLEGLFTARYVVENYTLNPLRDVVTELTPSAYTPNASWRAGGASTELGAHLKGIDEAINSTAGYAASCHYSTTALLTAGDNTITLGNPGTTGVVKYAVGAGLGVGYNEFTPSADGVWRLRMEINILGNGGGAADSGLRMQSYNGTTWADVAGENIYFSNSASLKNYVLESVLEFQVAGAVRKIRYVVIGVPESPAFSGAYGELVERSTDSPAIKFTAARI
jgi:hypothetical protein